MNLMKWLVLVVRLDVTGGVQASLPRRGDKGRNDRIFLKALHYLGEPHHHMPERFGKWNSVWNHVALRCVKTKQLLIYPGPCDRIHLGSNRSIPPKIRLL